MQLPFMAFLLEICLHCRIWKLKKLTYVYIYDNTNYARKYLKNINPLF
jgi:hypothetical protein